MKFIWGIFIIIAMSSISACVSEKARSEQLFEQYCNEDGRVGQFIYERVGLSEEYFMAIPTDAIELRRIADSFYIDNKNLLIDKQHFKQSYTANYLEKKMLSPIGPIYTIESTIVRKSDGKILSRAASLLNMLDKASDYFPVEGVTCPTGIDIQGNPLSNKHHFNLIENTFFKQ